MQNLTCAGNSITGVTVIAGALAAELCVGARSVRTAAAVVIATYIDHCKQSKLHFQVLLTQSGCGR